MLGTGLILNSGNTSYSAYSSYSSSSSSVCFLCILCIYFIVQMRLAQNIKGRIIKKSGGSDFETSSYDFSSSEF